MGVTWTEEQRQVIELRNRNLLVSAAAGSGKTAVLVERIVQKVLDQNHPVDIDRMLIVTFTKAAAAEMRERVSQAIEARMEQEPENSSLQRQATLVHNAQITTIDSFCLYVVRNYFQTIGLEPSFRIADPGELKLLKADVAAEVMEEHYKQKEEGFLQLADRYATARSDAALEEFMLRLYDFSQSYPWPLEWLASLGSHYQIENLQQLNEQAWMQGLLRYLGHVTADLKRQMQEAAALCMDADGPGMYLAAVQDDVALLEDLCACSSYEAYADRLSALKFTKLGVSRKYEGSTEKQDQVKEWRKTMKDMLGKLKKAFFYQDSLKMLSDIQKILPDVSALSELALAFSRAYRQKKEERNLLDFSDIEHYALKILVDEKTRQATAAARELRETYEEIMIDEYQDSNYVQETILRAVSREESGQNNIFMVGDVKQSIYRFRLARPELFIDKYKTYTAEESSCQKIDLYKNFRSRKETIDSINWIFYRIMHEDLGNVEYDTKAALYAGASYPQITDDVRAKELEEPHDADSQEAVPGDAYLKEELKQPHDADSQEAVPGDVYPKEKPEEPRHADSQEAVPADGYLKESRNNPFRSELLLAQASKEELAQDGMNSWQEMEARMTAARIRELLDSQMVTDKADGRLRPVRYQDIVILLRSMTGWADTFLKILTQAGIPAHTASRTGYFSAVEIQIILSMLSILDNPLQDIPFAAVLASPIGGMSGEELAEIKTYSREHFYYLALEEYAQYGPGGMEKQEHADEEGSLLREKAVRFLALYKKLRRLTAFTPVHKLIQTVLQETGYDSFIQAMPSGNQRRANVDMLVEKAAAYEKTSYKGLFHFVRYIEKLKKYEVDFGEADITSENENVVRIMSIHKSKGLEFPVVFVCGMGKQFNRQDTRSRLILHPEYGIGLDFIDADRRIRKSGFIKKILENEIGIENQGEELRVLYVALTRAKEKLILTGAVKEVPEETAERKPEPQHQEVKELHPGRSMDYFTRYQASCYLDWVYPCVKDAGDLFHIRIYKIQDLMMQEAVEAAVNRLSQRQVEQLFQTADRQCYRQLDEKLSWQYPFASDTDLKTKISVTELKRHQSEVLQEDAYLSEEMFTQERESIIPLFMQEGGSQEKKGALRGSAVHKIMEELDFVRSIKSTDRVADIRMQIQDMLDRQRITKEMKQLASPGLFAGFLNSPLLERMAKAQQQGQLYKEQPFVMGIPASRLYEKASGELVLIQGIVDVYWIEDGGLVILDYKTDSVKQEEELVKRYKIQLELYAEALQKAAGVQVKEKLIYSFALRKTVRVQD